MFSKFNLWPNSTKSLKVRDAMAEFQGEWPGVHACITASMTPDGSIEIQATALGPHDERLFGGGILRPTKKRTDKSPDFFGVVEIPESDAIKVSAWKSKKRNGDPFFSCAISPADSSSSGEEHDTHEESTEPNPFVPPANLASESSRELATILAALRFWQASGLGQKRPEMDIATDGGLFDALNSEEIDALREKLGQSYCSETKMVVCVSGGIFQGVSSTAKAEVLVLDCDTDGNEDARSLPDCSGNVSVFVPVLHEAAIEPDAVESVFDAYNG